MGRAEALPQGMVVVVCVCEGERAAGQSGKLHSLVTVVLSWCFSLSASLIHSGRISPSFINVMGGCSSSVTFAVFFGVY